MKIANDYLFEYKNNERCSEWMRKTIGTFLKENAEEHIDELADNLLGIATYNVVDEGDKKFDSDSDCIILKELLHKSGVNALAEKQSIKFTPEVNVIYGLNGTGKSSYFKIINEIAGGQNNTPIKPNVYADESKPVSVDIGYIFRDTEKSLQWNGVERGISDFGTIRVFDSKYTEDLLKKRSTDEMVLKPYRLFVFSDLISFIDRIVEKANDKIREKELEKPQIDTSDMQEDWVTLFNKEKLTSENIESLNVIFESTGVSEETLREKKRSLDDLRLGNPKDKITIKQGELKETQRVLDRIELLAKKINEHADAVSDDIRQYNVAKIQSEEHKNQLEVLRNIPGTDTEVWQEFISKGLDYSKEQKIDGICPYCHQPYSGNAKTIIDAYVSFLDDKSKTELDEIEKRLNAKKDEINSLVVPIEKNDEKWESDLSINIESALESVKLQKIKLLQIIDLRENGVISKVDVTKVCDDIASHIDDLEKEIKDLSEALDEKNKALTKIETDYKTLKSNYSIKKQQEKIKKVIEIESWIEKAKTTVADVASQKMALSNLSKKAHNELLTEQLKNSFIENLKSLGLKNVEIELQGKNKHGVQQTELVIRNDKDIASILSEGEQKAVALALFLSEISLSKNKSTVIFDDPVNSLDHRIMQAFSDLIMKMDNQIIVFTHSKYFLDCFQCSDYGHICKGLETACGKTKGKHIFTYETISEGKNKKGVVVEKNKHNLDYYLENVERLLSKSPFKDSEQVAYNIRRGVEMAIDEIVFNNLSPTKLSNKKSHIKWEELKKICNDEELIDGLRTIHNRMSGGEVHNGTEREENPLDKEELENFYIELKKLCHKD